MKNGRKRNEDIPSRDGEISTPCSDKAREKASQPAMLWRRDDYSAELEKQFA